MIIVWDCKTGRREFIEMLLKKEGYDVFSCFEVNSELLEQVQSLKPELIIMSAELAPKIQCDGEKWLLGDDIELPLEPLKLLKKVLKKLR